MTLDVQQLLTQVVGFLVLLWLLRRFAWPSLYMVLEERRAKIAAELADLDRMKAELARLEGEYRGRLAEIDAQARTRIQEAVAEGQRVGREIQEKARQDAAKTLERARQSLELEVATARAKLQDDVVALALLAAERVLRERVDEPKHRQLVADFIGDVERLK